MSYDNLRQQDQQLIAAAKHLRQQATPAETMLWQRLRAKQVCGVRFRRQQPIGPFVVDFFCAAARLVIEIDGASHEGEQKVLKDVQRQIYLERQGLKVLRFYNADTYSNLHGVLETIAQHCESANMSPPLAPPARGGESAA